ncbi:unnamed protein product [Rotaria sordida]|uniref:Uncharacterized protein n=2 Tax=Rotaria sordida TaxID=392033 RepID=A0A818Z8L3_9BILA|nr:unnamed protein product [Rotaria sordida]
MMINSVYVEQHDLLESFHFESYMAHLCNRDLSLLPKIPGNIYSRYSIDDLFIPTSNSSLTNIVGLQYGNIARSLFATHDMNKSTYLLSPSSTTNNTLPTNYSLNDLLLENTTLFDVVNSQHQSQVSSTVTTSPKTKHGVVRAD